MTKAQRSLSLAVLPETRNRLRLQPKVVACWAVGDGIFDFGHKFIGAEAEKDFRRFQAIREIHPDSPIALFGHTDPVGTDAYNHRLGYERALAVFAVLRRDPDLWFELFRNDKKGLAMLKERLGPEGNSDPNGVFGASTLEAVRRHLEQIGPAERLDVFDFLASGQAAVQSCAEFNPVLVPAPWMFEVLEEEEHRVALQAVNRRVVALFFDRATVTNLRWPCPPGGEGPGRCRTRFWKRSQTAIRETADGLQWWPQGFGGNPKLPWVPSEQVFACRFYQRLVGNRSCEKVDPYAVVPPDRLEPEPPDDPPPPIPKRTPRHNIPGTPFVPKPPPELAEVLVNCEHPFRFNKHTIAEETGDLKGRDEFAIVPPLEGDTIYMRVHPESERSNYRLRWDDNLLPWDDVAVSLSPHGFGTRTVEYVDADVENPLWLYTKEQILRRTVRIRVDGPGDDNWTIPIRVYPRDSASWDGLENLNDVRDFLGDWVDEMEEKLAMLIDDFEFKFIPEEGCDVGAEFQWRELPLVEEGKKPDPDYRVMFWWRFAFVFDPFISLRGTLKISYAKVLNTLRKWAKGSWAEKTLEWLLSSIPEEVFDALDAAQIRISPTVEGGANARFTRKSPDEELDIGPHEDGATKELEGATKVSLEGAGILNTASTLQFVETKLKLGLRDFEWVPELAEIARTAPYRGRGVRLAANGCPGA